MDWVCVVLAFGTDMISIKKNTFCFFFSEIKNKYYRSPQMDWICVVWVFGIQNMFKQKKLVFLKSKKSYRSPWMNWICFVWDLGIKTKTIQSINGNI